MPIIYETTSKNQKFSIYLFETGGCSLDSYEQGKPEKEIEIRQTHDQLRDLYRALHKIFGDYEE
jgi:hypothetical protein